MLPKPPYFWRSLVYLAVLLPLVFQISALLVLALAQLTINSSLGVLILCLPAGALVLWFGVHCGRRSVRVKMRSPATARVAQGPGHFADERRFLVRYLPVVLAFFYTLTVALIALFLPVSADEAIFGPFTEVFVITHLPACFFTRIITLFSVPSPWLYFLPLPALYAAYGCGLALGFRELDSPRTFNTGRFASIALIVVALAVIVWRTESMTEGFVRGGGRDAMFAESRFNQSHHPFTAGNTLVKIPAPTLVIEHDHPKLDGATAVYPVYAAAAQAIYKNIDGPGAREIILSSTTPKAYERLIAGEADLVFVAQPSPEQRAAAEAAGRPLQLTPIAREAFVFFVHPDNPIDGLTSDQIRAIYTKKITNWKEVGGRNEKIVPFQRPQGSGSQTALELKVMNGEKLPPPLREEFAKGMGGVIQRVAAYRNSREAIGYSFRVYATALNSGNEIKLLKIDGIAPSRENIRSKTYPYTVDVFAATAGTSNPNVPALLDWILSPQGQRLIDETGYVSLMP